MDFTTKQWLIGIILVVMLAILIDGFRRMRRARRDSLQMSLDPKQTVSSSLSDDGYGSEFPNGGARPSQKSIDRERIDEVKSQYDFGRDISDIIQRGKQSKPAHPLDEPEVPVDHYSEASDSSSQDQWVDEDEGDEEYYANKWDDEAPEATPQALDEPLEEPLVETSLEQEAAPEIPEPVLDEPAPRSSARDRVEPEQTSLNLEESVPVLMESVEEQQDDSAKPAYTDDIDDLEAPGDEMVEISASRYDDLGDEELEIRPVGKHTRATIEPTIDEEPLDTRSANKPRYKSKYFSSEVQEKTPPSNSITEVLVINVRSSNNQMIAGSDLLMAVLDNGLRFGEMDIFHCHADEDGEGPVLFSMANMLKPGTFELKNMDSFSTVGVTFFLTLPVFDNQNMAAYEQMLATAKNVAASLGAELNDDQRSIMTAQTMEHYRERIRDFARRQQLEKNK